MPFSKLSLAPAMIRGVQAMGYTEPTPVQLRAIPVVMSGKDLIASAQTGTGKTAAFALPVLSLLGAHRAGGPRVLVLEPTRELAAQVETAFRDFSRYSDIRATVLHGGVGYGRQRSELRAGADVVVATPGRLLDFLQEGELKLGGIQILILDEVDRMLDMGFIHDVRRIIQRCPAQRQTLFFSATVPPEIASVASFALRDPVRVEIGAVKSVTQLITHAIYPVHQEQKFDLLLALLSAIDFNSVLVFSRTKHGADRIARRPRERNHTRRGPLAEPADGGARGIPERPLRGDGGHRHRGPRHRRGRRVARHQLRRPREPRGLRAPDRQDRPGAGRRRRGHRSAEHT